MYVGMLLQSTRGGKGLSAFGTGVTAGPDVRGSDVPLQVARICEHLVTVLTGKPAELAVDHLVT